MADFIISIIPQVRKPPIFDDYKLVVTVFGGDKLLNIYPQKRDAIGACELAIVISQVLELSDDIVVRFSTLAGDDVCEACIAAYRRKQEKEAAANANSNRQTND